MTTPEVIDRLHRAAVILREQGGEEEYDCADACEIARTSLARIHAELERHQDAELGAASTPNLGPAGRLPGD